MVAAGGILAPSATGTLTIALLGTLGASSCAIGAASTPIALWAYSEWDHLSADLGRQTVALGQRLWQAAGFLSGDGARATAIAAAVGSVE